MLREGLRGSLLVLFRWDIISGRRLHLCGLSAARHKEKCWTAPEMAVSARAGHKGPAVPPHLVCSSVILHAYEDWVDGAGVALDVFLEGAPATARGIFACRETPLPWYGKVNKPAAAPARVFLPIPHQCGLLLCSRDDYSQGASMSTTKPI